MSNVRRYFVLCKHDFTLRRYNSADEVEAPTKPPRIYRLQDIEYVGQVRLFPN
jgi:hypothetical protein